MKKRTLTNKQLVAVSGLPYTKKELDALRLIEKMTHIIVENATKEDLEKFEDLISNGWSNAFDNILCENIYPRSKEDMEYRINEYEECLKNIFNQYNDLK